MAKQDHILVGIPVFNESKFVDDVLQEVLTYADHVLVIDDGSTDDTPARLANHPVKIIRHAVNRGYGRSTRDMLHWAAQDGFEWLITMDCDLQHEPALIPDFRKRIAQGDVDFVSGSRYVSPSDTDHMPPPDRREVNQIVTEEINQRLGLNLTDGFCGFKAYRVSSCCDMKLDVDGYDFPMQFWVQAVAAGLKIDELPVSLIYNDPNRSFGGPLDDQQRRLRHYRSTLHEEIIRCSQQLPDSAIEGLDLVDCESELPGASHG